MINRRAVVVGLAALVSASLVALPSHPILAQENCPEGRAAQEVAVGVPRWAERSGLVDVRGDGRPDQLVTSPSRQPGDEFGAAVVLADLNADHCPDLVVGAPGATGGGAVHLFLGSPSGFVLGSSIKLPHRGAAGDRFGAAIAVQQLWASGLPGELARIWVGAPGTDVLGRPNAGAVVHYLISSPWTISSAVVLTEETPGVPGGAESGDAFGEVLSPYVNSVVVGAPHEDVGARTDAGAVKVIASPGTFAGGPGPYTITQDSPDVPGGVEAGDRFGASLSGRGSRFWIGVPGEDLGSRADAGLVLGVVLDVEGLEPDSAVTAVTQDSPGVPGGVEAGDRFGASLQALSWPLSCPLSDGVAIGVPGEDISRVVDAGAVVLHTSFAGAECAGRAADQGVAAEAHDQFGASVGMLQGGTGAGDGPDHLLVGAPGEDVGATRDAGVVDHGVLKCCSQSRLFPLDSTYALPSPNRPGLRYGAVIARLADGFGEPL